jgi:AcrR family transcriptional regulator
MGRVTTSTAPSRGGRGARERILRAAAGLFYEQGINTTGMAELSEVASVSKRTLYQHFASKDELVEAYLKRFDEEKAAGPEKALDRTELTPRERLVGMFDVVSASTRGCPYLNAAIEIADVDSPARHLITEHKQRFTEKLIEVAREAGATEPELLGHQLAVLFDGAAAGVTTDRTGGSASFAKSAAETLIDLAIRG